MAVALRDRIVRPGWWPRTAVVGI